MDNILEKILAEGIRSGVLKENRLAAVLLHTVKTGQFFKLSRRELANILVAREMPETVIKEIAESNDTQQNTFSDLRMVGVSLSGIKKFPPRKGDKDYGLSFSRKGEPVSSIFVGANGIGKTSIYSALEYAGMRKINTAAARGYTRKIGQAPDRGKIPKEDQLAFLRHLGTHISKMAIRLFTKDRDINLEGKDIRNLADKPEVTEVFYCSDYDVRELETREDNTRFMLRQIGLNHLYHAIQLTYYLGVFVKTKQKPDFNSMWSVTPEYTKPIQRLLLGISTGHLNVSVDFKDWKNMFELLESVINKHEDHNLVKNTVESSISTIKEEQAYFQWEDWFSSGVYAQYEELLDALRDFQKNEFSPDYPLRYKIIATLKNFQTFRNYLKTQIAAINTKLNEVGDVRESKFDLIEEIATPYNESISYTGTISSSDKDGIFTNEEYKKRFPNEYNKLVRYLENCLKDFLNEWEAKIATPVEDILSDYFAMDNDRISISLKFTPSADSIKMINEISDDMEYPDIHKFVCLNVKVITEREGSNSDEEAGISPRKYLNTFRFKLFCVALKIVLGCFVKEKYSLNFPYVIDDVFDSSDFDSRLRLKRFIEEIVKSHDSLLDSKTYPIQIIFFSQDDLIADQIYKGLVACKGPRDVKFGRIYDYRDNGESDIKELTLGYEVCKPNPEKTADLKNKDNLQKISYISIEDIIEE